MKKTGLIRLGILLIGVGGAIAGIIRSEKNDKKMREEERSNAEKIANMEINCSRCGCVLKNKDAVDAPKIDTFVRNLSHEKYGDIESRLFEEFFQTRFSAESFEPASKICCTCQSDLECKFINMCAAASDDFDKLIYNGDVKTYPITYQGKIPVDHNCDSTIETSFWYRDKEDALKELKLRAQIRRCNCVYDIDYEYVTDSDDNYYYKVWRAKGILSELR